MAIRSDHTIVPATDKIAAAEFVANTLGLTVKPGPGYVSQVQVKRSAAHCTLG
jgi:hypothetical protein